METAKRSSCNCAAGAPVMKSMDSISFYQYRRILISFVLPAIKTKWSFNSTPQKIKFQQDNARPHIEPTNREFLQATFALILNIVLVFQPPNSPDLNLLDLGYFNSIQSLQYQSDPKNIQKLVEMIGTSFDALHWTKQNDSFLTLQKVMEAIILCNGNINFKVPDICKRKLERTEQLTVRIKVLDSVKEKLEYNKIT